jgi:hypothetical protein
MNSTANSFPGFWALYRIEPLVRRAFTTMMLGLMLAAGIWWVIQPQPNAVPQTEPSVEVLYAPWISAGGGVLSILAGSYLVWRTLWVREVICHGSVVQGTAELTDVYDTNMRGSTSGSTSTIRTRPTYVYYVTVRYDVRGGEHTVRVKLPFSPSTYGIKKGGKVDLLVLESAPHKPLIRAVYLGRKDNWQAE